MEFARTWRNSGLPCQEIAIHFDGLDIIDHNIPAECDVSSECLDALIDYHRKFKQENVFKLGYGAELILNGDKAMIMGLDMGLSREEHDVAESLLVAAATSKLSGPMLAKEMLDTLSDAIINNHEQD